jgi:cytochrome c oxidase cbb3-type subunit I/II
MPRLWRTQLYSKSLATVHFWMALLGIAGYVLSMWAAGITEGLMWKEFDADGRLVYPIWAEMVPSLAAMYWVRALSGATYFGGAIVLAWNLYKTWQTRTDLADEVVEVTMPDGPGATSSVDWHHKLEGKPMAFTIWTTIAVAAGGLFELIPSMAIKGNIPTIEAVRPYSPLELEGRDVYISEGCVNCHSQMVRPFREETLRYGEYSKPGEYVYDHPFLWGSRRIGPDLQRVGGKYPDSWHYDHMMDPQSMSPGSLMPTYTHLFEQPLNFGGIDAKVQIFSGTFGAPYNKYDLEHVEVMARGQAATIAEGLMAEGRPDIRDKKIVALIAYLQRLGTDIRAQAPEATP